MGTFGSGKYNPKEVSDAVYGAINYGYRFFDYASVYGNEDLIGKVFEKAIQPGFMSTWKQMEEIYDRGFASHNIHPALVCVKWTVQRGSIPIPFSVHEKNYKSNLLAVTNVPLGTEEMILLTKAERNCRLVKGQVFLWASVNSWEYLWEIDGKINVESSYLLYSPFT